MTSLDPIDLDGVRESLPSSGERDEVGSEYGPVPVASEAVRGGALGAVGDSRRTHTSRLLSTLGQARFNRNELAGSLGDLGTFLPLLVGMAAQNGLDFAAALFLAGLFNVVTGLLFTIPLAVQPMKAIAAVALTEGLTAGEIQAAGATVGVVILVLGVTGLMDWLNRAVPKSVVRGLQLALGLSLLMKGMQMVAATNLWWGIDSYSTGFAAALVVLLLFFSRRVPAALLLFLGGLAFAVWENPAARDSLTLQWSLPGWDPPTWQQFATSFPRAALPQIPLTTLNSVVAVCALSADLFPDRRAEPRRVAVSVGVMSLVACGWGGMPMCHGAGGMAAQYRFGARTNGSILFLGGVKMLLAASLGLSLMSLCQSFPNSILGVLLAFAGMELALVCRDQRTRTNAFAMFITAAACMALGNIALGFLLGWVMAWCLQLGLFQARETPVE